jgi:hypothetical protein
LRRVLRRLAPLVACLVLAACGGSGEEDEVKKVVNGLYAGFADRDANRVCDSLSRKQREAVTAGAGGKKPQSCEQVMSIALSFVGDELKKIKNAEVTSVEVDGDSAKATVKYRGKETGLGLAKEDGEWRISNLKLAAL